jgi:hypothetical protein
MELVQGDMGVRDMGVKDLEGETLLLVLSTGLLWSFIMGVSSKLSSNLAFGERLCRQGLAMNAGPCEGLVLVNTYNWGGITEGLHWL